MKQFIIGIIIGTIITIVLMELRPRSTNPDLHRESGIIVIPESRNIVPGESFNLYIIPVLDIAPRWFSAINLKAGPELEAEMHSSTSLYTVCSLKAPVADSLSEGSTIALEASVELIQDGQKNEDVIRQPIKMLLQTEGEDSYWVLKY